MLRFGLSLALVFGVSRDIIWLVVAAAASYLLPLSWMAGVGRKLARPDAAFIRTIAAYGLPMVGWTMAATILDVSDRFVIGLVRGAGEVGIYSANYSLAKMLITFVGIPIVLAAEPLVMAAWESGDRGRIGDVIRAFSRYFLIIVVPVAVFASVLARPIAGIVFGTEFHEGARVIAVVLPGLTIWTFGNFGTKGLKLAERTGLMLVLVLVSATVNLALNFLLVPRFGYYGAAWGSLAAFSLYPLLVYYRCKSSVPWSIPWASVARVSVSAAVVGSAWLVAARTLGHVGWLELAWLGISGIIVYGVLLDVLRELSLRQLIAGILSRS
jgi:O-antigen/teichoic acid export membrane protein